MPKKSKILDGKKECAKCKELILVKDFYSTRKGTTTYLHSYCKVCMNKNTRLWQKDNHARFRMTARRSQLQKKYGMSLEEFNERVKQQRGLCHSCGEIPPIVYGQTFRVDHSHTANKNRGLLCHNCNLGLGYFKDSPDRLRKAAKYLEYWNEQHETTT